MSDKKEVCTCICHKCGKRLNLEDDLVDSVLEKVSNRLHGTSFEKKLDAGRNVLGVKVI